ncbi:Tn3 family transposase [Microbispora sp. RL4-1S]|uniref:Tn3 family transposase n=1 Tax=Microbispora oryzae TaxID=2806554 RepID=A0A941ALZ5_9ACTN|nr:Tn3 family transposase [Microbispora oryzae]MBP2708626.1 Tn3 family transposase [Microbispora oryzae]
MGAIVSFLAVQRLARDRDLQQEIQECLNVVKPWNRATAAICYYKGGEISTSRREKAEMAALCLCIRWAMLVHGNALTLQNMLAEPEGRDCSRRGHEASRTP